MWSHFSKRSVLFKGADSGPTANNLWSPLFVSQHTTGYWLADHLLGKQRVRAADIRRTLQHEYAQRIDPDRISNPHSEHAQEIFTMLDVISPSTLGANKAAPQVIVE